MVRKKDTSQGERSMLLFRGFITKKRSQIKGWFEVFRNLYLRDLIRENIHSGTHSHGEVSTAGWGEARMILGTDDLG